MRNTIHSLAALVAGVALFAATGFAQAGLVAFYPLNGNTNDIKSGFNGTVSGTTTYNSAGVFGNGMQAFSFNGSTNIATTTAANLGLNSSFTVEAWVNLPSPTTDQTIFGAGAGGSTDTGIHLLDRGDKPFMGFYSDDTPGNTPLAANTWYNLAYTFDATTGKQSIYVSTLGAGNTITTSLDASSGGHSSFTGSGTATIGTSCCAGNPTGLFEYVQVYNTALTIDQVHTAASLTPEPSSLILCGLGTVGLIVAARRRRKA